MNTKTNKELAELYKTNSNTLTVNFKRHPEKFQEGKHYILDGKTYHWTKEGAFLHARFLNTDEAWEGYKEIPDDVKPHNTAELEQEIIRLNAFVTKQQETIDMYMGALNRAGDENEKLQNQKRQTGLPPTSVMDIEMLLNRLRKRLKEERINTGEIVHILKQLQPEIDKTLEIEETNMLENMKQTEFRSTIQEQFILLTQSTSNPLLESPQ